MKSKGYDELSNRFLTKEFAASDDINERYNVTITINDETVTAITGYDNNEKLVDLPKEIIKIVENDLKEALEATGDLENIAE